MNSTKAKYEYVAKGENKETIMEDKPLPKPKNKKKRKPKMENLENHNENEDSKLQKPKIQNEDNADENSSKKNNKPVKKQVDNTSHKIPKEEQKNKAMKKERIEETKGIPFDKFFVKGNNNDKKKYETRNTKNTHRNEKTDNDSKDTNQDFEKANHEKERKRKGGKGKNSDSRPDKGQKGKKEDPKKNKTRVNFQNYISLEEIEKGLADGSLYEGEYIANKRTRHMASINCKLFSTKVFLNCIDDQNRAFHNSLVVFKLLGKQEKELQEKRIKEEKTRREALEKKENPETKEDKKVEEKEEELKLNTEDLNIEAHESSTEIIKNPDSNENNENAKEEIENEEKEKESKKVGKIVYIKTNSMETRNFVAKLEKGMMKALNPNLPWFAIQKSPTDSHLPEGMYYLCKYSSWKTDRFFPSCTIIKLIGQPGEIGIETLALLEEFSINISEIGEDSINQVKSIERQYVLEKMMEKEISKREDLRGEMILSIDPATARDLDDALSITSLGNDLYEIGVHIADVSHFVTEGSPLDQEARQRTTSVYLPYMVYPMLPPILSEILCSLNPHEDRLAFSVFFTLDGQGNLVKEKTPRISKTVIRSRGKFSYEIVQDIIDDKITKISEIPIGNRPSDVNESELFTKIKLLNRIAQQRRKMRVETGSLTFDKSKMKFILDEKGNPINYVMDSRQESNFLVEEYMLLGNMITAEMMVKHLGKFAVLRRHPVPKLAKTDAVSVMLKEYGLTIDFTNSLTTQQSLSKILSSEDISVELKEIISFQMLRTNNLAEYLMKGDLKMEECRHFALNIDYYTHFTSPIRRYPDILVHRILTLFLDHKAKAVEFIQEESILSVMTKCNENKIQAKRVSEATDRLFFMLIVQKNPLRVPAIIELLNKSYIVIFSPQLDYELRMEPRAFKKVKKTAIDEDGREMIFTLESKNEDGTNKEFKIKKHHICTVEINSTNSFPMDFKFNFVTDDGELIE